MSLVFHTSLPTHIIHYLNNKLHCLDTFLWYPGDTPKGAFASTQPREVNEVPEITANYCYGVQRSGGPAGVRSVFS